MLDRVRAMPRKLKRTAQHLASSDSVVLRWATEGVISRNWGDKLNPYMAEKISGKKVVHRAEIYPFLTDTIHYWIGSHLATACADPKAVVWGAGFISQDVPILGAPREIRAVRGWLSHQRLKEKGIAAPDIVGDAALLLPRLYEPARTLQRKSLGVIPHCFEWDEPFFATARSWDDCRIIDICGSIEEVVEQIVACDRIVSSSLHGIICADAYGIPSIWLHASDKPAGDGFKFRDYFTSVGRADRHPILVDGTTSRQQLENRFQDYSLEIDLDTLWDACPLKPDAQT